MMLQSTWFFIWGLLWAVFFITDGFDFGVGTLYPFIGKNDEEKRIMLNAIGPLWDGNEVWLITAGGVTFAAFPLMYAVMFSSLYSALMLILFALILRGVAIDFRSKSENILWRKAWDICMFVGSFVPALLFGVAFANIYKGLPIDGQGVYHGSLLTLLNPYGLLGGILYLVLFINHGALWLAIRTNNELHARSVLVAKKIWPVLLVLAVVFLIYSKFETRLFDNYFAHPSLFIVVIITVAAILGIRYFLSQKTYFKAWFSSAAAIIGATFFGIIGMYPNMLPSSLSDTYNITAQNASSSPLTLKIMLVVVIVFIPVVIAYQIWAYWLFNDKVTKEDLAYDEAY
jgi:cytochrome d ubiquinol oxidase subunit II